MIIVKIASRRSADKIRKSVEKLESFHDEHLNHYYKIPKNLDISKIKGVKVIKNQKIELMPDWKVSRS